MRCFGPSSCVCLWSAAVIMVSAAGLTHLDDSTMSILVTHQMCISPDISSSSCHLQRRSSGNIRHSTDCSVICLHGSALYWLRFLDLNPLALDEAENLQPRPKHCVGASEKLANR